MCIRDSLEDQFLDVVGLVRIVRHQGVQRMIEAVGRIVGRPVSYTHLRAHETVLDLVCRLLLEKKKRINYSLNVDAYTEETDWHWKRNTQSTMKKCD